MPKPDPFDLPYRSIEFEDRHSVEDIFEDLFISRVMLPGEFGKFMLIRRMFRHECQELLDQIWARMSHEAGDVADGEGDQGVSATTAS